MYDIRCKLNVIPMLDRFVYMNVAWARVACVRRMRHIHHNTKYFSSVLIDSKNRPERYNTIWINGKQINFSTNPNTHHCTQLANFV